jgi:EcoEI R protein C-terminal
MDRRIFPEGTDDSGKDGGLPYEEMRWSRFRNAAPARMYEIIREHVFPLRWRNTSGSTLGSRSIPKPARNSSKSSPRCRPPNVMELKRRSDSICWSLARARAAARFEAVQGASNPVAGDCLRARGTGSHSRHCGTGRADRGGSDQQWWEGVTVPLLELVRLRLRDLVQHIEKGRKAIVYSDFADQIGVETEHALPQVGEIDFLRFKQKARAFLRAHENHITLHKLRQGRPLTGMDLAELEAMLIQAGIGDPETIERARETSVGFGGSFGLSSASTAKRSAMSFRSSSPAGMRLRSKSNLSRW